MTPRPVPRGARRGAAGHLREPQLDRAAGRLRDRQLDRAAFLCVVVVVGVLASLRGALLLLRLFCGAVLGLRGVLLLAPLHQRAHLLIHTKLVSVAHEVVWGRHRGESGATRRC